MGSIEVHSGSGLSVLHGCQEEIKCEETRDITELFLFTQCICLIFSSFYARLCPHMIGRLGGICNRYSMKQNRQIAVPSKSLYFNG